MKRTQQLIKQNQRDANKLPSPLNELSSPALFCIPWALHGSQQQEPGCQVCTQVLTGVPCTYAGDPEEPWQPSTLVQAPPQTPHKSQQPGRCPSPGIHQKSRAAAGCERARVCSRQISVPKLAGAKWHRPWQQEWRCKSRWMPGRGCQYKIRAWHGA